MSKISQYAPAAALTGVELIPAVQGGNTVTLTPAVLLTYTFSDFGANTFPARSSSGDLAAKPITDFALTLLDDVDAATARATLGAQASDGTLTALAGQNWAANSLPIGSGPDTVSQVAFAANTFPARSSAGNLVAKPITDFALTILDDANATAVLATLGIAHGTYTPTCTGVLNVDACSGAVCQYMRVGNTVTVSGSITVDPTATSNTQVGVSLPIPSALTSISQVGGAGVRGTVPVAIYADFANDRAMFEFTANTTASGSYPFTFTYLVL
jgi:hypothetical protein